MSVWDERGPGRIEDPPWTWKNTLAVIIVIALAALLVLLLGCTRRIAAHSPTCGAVTDYWQPNAGSGEQPRWQPPDSGFVEVNAQACQ
jgi:hypothetical protein